MNISRPSADHGEEIVILKSEDGKTLAHVESENAIKLAHEILDCAEKSLRGSGRLHLED